MTSRERIIEAMRLGQPDRVPVSPFTLGALDPNSAICMELIEKTDPFLSPGIGGDPFTGSVAQRDVTTDGDTTVITWHTPKGDLVSRWRRTSITSAQVEYPIKTPDDAERFLSMPFVPAEPNLDEFRRTRADIGDEGMTLAGTVDGVLFPATWLSPEDFCLWFLDHPGLLKQLTQVAAGRLYEYVRKACEGGVDAFRIVGGEYASVQLGPRGFDELVTPFDAELISLIHSYGALVYYHNHGPMQACLEKIAALGMDALDPLEAPPWGDIELGEAVCRISDSVCCVGNLDDMEIVDRLPEDQVVQLAMERLESAGGRRLILGGTASGTYTERGARAFIAMAEEVRRRSS